jgi:hypothetical protein
MTLPDVEMGKILLSNHTPPGTGPFRLPTSTICMGTLALLFLDIGAFASGFAGVLVMLGLFALLTCISLVRGIRCLDDPLFYAPSKTFASG